MEDSELNENFTWIDYEKDGEIYYAMGTKYKTSYRKGDQLFNCYGLRTNRFLLLNYGFCLRNNKYNSLGFKVFVNYKPAEKSKDEDNDETDESRYQKVIKLKRDKLSEGKLPNMCIFINRATLISEGKLDFYLSRTK
jgi:hypothetical protein